MFINEQSKPMVLGPDVCCGNAIDWVNGIMSNAKGAIDVLSIIIITLKDALLR